MVFLWHSYIASFASVRSNLGAIAFKILAIKSQTDHCYKPKCLGYVSGLVIMYLQNILSFEVWLLAKIMLYFQYFELWGLTPCKNYAIFSIFWGLTPCKIIWIFWFKVRLLAKLFEYFDLRFDSLQKSCCIFTINVSFLQENIYLYFKLTLYKKVLFLQLNSSCDVPDFKRAKYLTYHSTWLFLLPSGHSKCTALPKFAWIFFRFIEASQIPSISFLGSWIKYWE